VNASSHIIKLTTIVPGEENEGTFELLQYPTLEECRMQEGTEEPLIFVWQIALGLTTRIPFRADVVGGDEIQTFVHGRTSQRGYPGHKAVVTFDGEVPVEMRYLKRVEPSV
jgi:hypothetical protein